MGRVLAQVGFQPLPFSPVTQKSRGGQTHTAVPPPVLPPTSKCHLQTYGLGEKPGLTSVSQRGDGAREEHTFNIHVFILRTYKHLRIENRNFTDLMMDTSCPHI